MKINYTKIIITLSLLVTYSQVNAQWDEVESNDDIYQGQENDFKQESFEIVLEAQEAIEYKFDMKKNDSIVYQWTSNIESAELLPVEFHGHTHINPDSDSEILGTLIFYKKHSDGEEKGSLTAPFDGIHGWYVENNSDQEITIKLDVAGWYEKTLRLPVPR